MPWISCRNRLNLIKIMSQVSLNLEKEKHLWFSWFFLYPVPPAAFCHLWTDDSSHSYCSLAGEGRGSVASHHLSGPKIETPQKKAGRK